MDNQIIRNLKEIHEGAGQILFIGKAMDQMIIIRTIISIEHVNAQARQYLHKTICSKAKQSQGFVGGSKKSRYQTFQHVIPDGDQAQNQGDPQLVPVLLVFLFLHGQTSLGSV